LAGCRSAFDLARFRDREDEKVREMAATDDVRGPLERFLESGSFRKEKSPRFNTPPEALREFDKAESLLKLGEVAEAEDSFERVAKKYSDTPIREDALFLLGECQFRQKKFPAADDSYGRVVKEFPATRYLDTISQRKFEIARTWLGFPDIVTASEVQPVNFEKPSATPPPKSSKPGPSGPSYAVPIFPNVWDRSRPVFDTKGRALQALKSIWLNDPTGPLADDALMLTASHYLREGDYLEADRIYATLRQEYPKSRHLENAFVLGSHVKLMSYQGAPYDGTSLEEARKLTESTLRLYPNHPDRERLLDEVRRIEDAHAAREWEDIRFYQKKGLPKSVAVYCKELIRKYPHSSYATQAREVLARLSPADKSDVIPNPYEARPPAEEASDTTGRTKLADESAPRELAPDDSAGEIGGGEDSTGRTRL